jgi:hypothetical protein
MDNSAVELFVFGAEIRPEPPPSMSLGERGMIPAGSKNERTACEEGISATTPSTRRSAPDSAQSPGWPAVAANTRDSTSETPLLPVL